MKTALNLDVFGVREFRSVEVSKVVLLPVEHYSGPPHLVSGMPRHTEEPAFVPGVMAFPVLTIDGLRNVSEVDDAVVRSNAIDVVDSVGRPRTMQPQPSKPVRKVFHAVNADLGISASVVVADGGGSAPVRGANQSRKRTCFRAVVQDFAQATRGKIGFSHDVLLSRCGQIAGQRYKRLSGFRILRSMRPA